MLSNVSGKAAVTRQRMDTDFYPLWKTYCKNFMMLHSATLIMPARR